MNPEQKMPDNELKNTLSEPSSRSLKARKKWFSWGVGLSFLVLALLAAGGFYQYRENKKLHKALAQQDTAVAHIKTTQIDLLNESKALHATLTARVEGIAKTLQTLSALYQRMNNDEAQRLLADIEQNLIMASEALYLTHDTAAALKLLQYADDKVQSVNHPEMVKLHAALQKDIQALSALPQVDIAREMARLDTLLENINALPLHIDIQRTLSTQKTAEPINSQLPWWKQLGHNIWAELKSLVQIRRLDKPQEALLSLDQVMLLRENIKLRLVSARIALMTRNQAAYTADLQAVQKYLQTYFDQTHPSTKQSAELLQQLFKVQLVNDEPTFTSLAALRAVRLPVVLKEGEQG